MPRITRISTVLLSGSAPSVPDIPGRFQYLLERLGIECIYVVGTAQGQEAHAWNIVKCDGEYYHVDATFGDPVFLGAESGEDLPPDIIYYDYLCCTDQEILKDHTPADGFAYPACVSDDLNYYRMNGIYFDAYDPQTIPRRHE